MSNKCWFCHATDKSLSFHRFPRDDQLRKLWIDATGREYVQPPRTALLCGKHFSQDCFLVKANINRVQLKKGSIQSVVSSEDRVTQAKARQLFEQIASTSSEDTVSITQLPTDTLPTTSKQTSLLKHRLPPHNLTAETEPRSKCARNTFEVDSAIITPVIPNRDEAYEKSRSTTDNVNSTTPTKKVAAVRKRFVKNPRYVGHCSLEDLKSPRKAARNWSLALAHINEQRKKIKTANRTITRLRKTVTDMKSMLKNVQKKELISDEAANFLNVSNIEFWME